MKNKLFFLLLIVVVASVLRLYRLESIPPALSWDEVDVGYNAYSISQWGYDEWGNFFPVVFKSFEDDKNPVHIYFTSLSVKVFGLSDFAVRFPAALFGILNVVLIYYLTQILFNKQYLSLSAAFFLAISPYSLQFSRFNHEANFALFFMMLGVYLFFVSLKNAWLLPVSALSFSISLLSYHSSKIVVPIIMLFLWIAYYKDLIKSKYYVFIAFVITLCFAAIFFYHPALLGGSRLSQTAITGTNLLDKYTQAYLSHFSWKYFFESGDSNVRHSTQVIGEFYMIEIVLLVLGAWGLIAQRSRPALIVLCWFLVAPIPASIGNESPHAARSLFMMGSGNIISAYGFYQLLTYFRDKKIKILILTLVFSLIIYQFIGYLKYYYSIYPVKSAVDWQYGMKQIAEYIGKNEKYPQVFITDERHQPYAFMLFYLKTPLPDFITTVSYNNRESRSYNLVSNYSKFQFGGWDKIRSTPDDGRLYVLTPSEYDGLLHKKDFQVKKIIRYPDNSGVFYIISVN